MRQDQACVEWEGKHHAVIFAKCRFEVLCGNIRSKIVSLMGDLCRQKGLELVEGYALLDHIHMVLSIPPRFSLVTTVGNLLCKKAFRFQKGLLLATFLVLPALQVVRNFIETVAFRRSTA